MLGDRWLLLAISLTAAVLVLHRALAGQLELKVLLARIWRSIKTMQGDVQIELIVDQLELTSLNAHLAANSNIVVADSAS